MIVSQRCIAVVVTIAMCSAMWSMLLWLIKDPDNGGFAFMFLPVLLLGSIVLLGSAIFNELPEVTK